MCEGKTDAAASMKANGYCGTSPIRGDCPTVLADLEDHAVKSDICAIEDYENIADFHGRVTQFKTNHRGKPVVLLQDLKSQFREIGPECLSVPSLFLCVWHAEKVSMTPAPGKEQSLRISAGKTCHEISRIFPKSLALYGTRMNTDLTELHG